MELTGNVVLRKFGAGSKSEHDAVYLETKNASYVLRKMGGNPFHDESLHQLIGKTVTVKGFINNYTFLAKELKENI